MKHQKESILKYISIIQRNTQKYYDIRLQEDHIGSGQQFFILRIAENEGLTMYELSKLGQFDKGTTSKAVQKLEEEGYVSVKIDEKDKRIRRIYTTEKAQKLIHKIYHIRDSWVHDITASFSEEERKKFFEQLVSVAAASCVTLESL